MLSESVNVQTTFEEWFSWAIWDTQAILNGPRGKIVMNAGECVFKRDCFEMDIEGILPSIISVATEQNKRLERQMAIHPMGAYSFIRPREIRDYVAFISIILRRNRVVKDVRHLILCYAFPLQSYLNRFKAYMAPARYLFRFYVPTLQNLNKKLVITQAGKKGQNALMVNPFITLEEMGGLLKGEMTWESPDERRKRKRLKTSE